MAVCKTLQEAIIKGILISPAGQGVDMAALKIHGEVRDFIAHKIMKFQGKDLENNLVLVDLFNFIMEEEQ